MKIGIAWEDWNETAGGGYVFVTDILRELFRNDSKNEHEFILLRLDASPMPAGLENAAFFQCDGHAGYFKKIIHRLLKMIGRKTPNNGRGKHSVSGKPLEECVDLVVFLYPRVMEDASLPQMTVIWDLAHRYVPCFPEISHGGTKNHREKYFTSIVRNADRIIVGTSRGAEELEKYYGYERENIGVIPHPTPTSVVQLKKEAVNCPSSSEKPFALYPAQFWAHKNHMTLLHAWKELKRRGKNIPKLVFVGKDYGLESWLKEQSVLLGVDDLVDFQGFVSRDKLMMLYSTASLLVYPSLFGPENLPPLEAMATGCPVIVSDYPGAREQYRRSALYVSPLDASAWADSIQKLLTDTEMRKSLVECGKSRAQEWTATDFACELKQQINRMAAFRSLWKSVQ